MEFLAGVEKFLSVLKPLVDIAIIAFLIYQVYKILLHTKAIQLIKGAMLIAMLYAMAYFMNLETLLWVMNKLGTVLIVIIAVVFQPEIRNLFTRFGQGRLLRFTSASKSLEIDTILNAAEILSTMRRGCLIVFVGEIGLKNIIESGTKLNADISSNLILTIFGKDTPLHDGAIIIQGSKITAAGCFLPLSEQLDIKRSFGTRHRAAIGLSETTDSVILIVSEETGAISIASDGSLYYDLEKEEIPRTLRSLLSIKDKEEREKEEVEIED
ncbi:MAG: diadenylate cyclase CdaA [Spirochaetia bacterium]|nr:diadenylate cyclase CdaA [Spirochaetia bacterium]